MSKSNYPSKIDSTTELPIVRDNLLQVGSEAINSIRSAVVQIEKTLGINPQGGVGETVASRLSKSFDEVGNLLPEAIDRAGLISGPIVNEDVSSAAGIKESKLDLDFPTSILQSEISSLNHEVESIVNRITAIAAALSSHLALSSERHAAASISTAEIVSSGALTAVKSLLDTNAQDALDKIFSGHINFSGSISEANSSHTASQIWIDSQNLPFEAGSVQVAIENIYSTQEGDLTLHQRVMHSSGIAKEYLISGGRGAVIVSAQPVSYSERSGDERGISQITFISPISASSFNVLAGQEAVIENPTDEDGLAAGSYTIYSVEKSSDGTQILSVYVYGTFGVSSNSSSTLSVYKNKYVSGALSSLLVAPRESASGTDSFILQVCNPSSSYIISSGIQPSFLNASNRYMSIQINSESAVSFDFYSSGDSVQTIDSIVKRFNEQAEESHSNLLAYRYDSLAGSELVIAYNIPNSSSETYSISVDYGSDDGIEALGFSHLIGSEVISDVQTPYFISGNSFSGLPLKFSSEQISYLLGGNSVSLTDVSQSFIDSKVSENDLLIISDAGSDSGTYRIISVSDGLLVLDPAQLPSGFSASSVSGYKFRVYKNSVAVDQLQFAALSGVDAGYLLDLFLDSSGEFRHQIAVAYESPLHLSSSVFSIVDFSGDVAEKEYSLQFSKQNGFCVVFLENGDYQRVFGSDFSFWLTHSDGNKLKVYIKDLAALSSKIDASGEAFFAQIYGVHSVSTKIDSLLLGRIPFEAFQSRFSGSLGNAKLEKKSLFGMISTKDIQEEVEKQLVHHPLSAIISNGVLSGLDVSNTQVNSSGFFTLQILQGEVFIAGKRLLIKGSESFNTGISSDDSDKFFIAINEQGQICARPCNEDCISPFDPYHFVLIGSVEWDDVDAVFFDARLFVSSATFRYLTQIVISPDPLLGQFTSLSSALKYRKRFSEFYPNLTAPDLLILGGEYEEVVAVDATSMSFSDWYGNYASYSTRSISMSPFVLAAINNGLFINFPVKITGATNAKVSIRYDVSFSDVNYLSRGFVYISGRDIEVSGVTYDGLTSGFVQISGVEFNNTRIAALEVLSDNSKHYGVVIDSCVFDYDNFTETDVDIILGKDAVYACEIFDFSLNKGCLSISNSKFIKSCIRFDSPTRVKNVSIINNQVLGDEDQALITGDILTLSAESNITIISNLNRSDISGLTTSLVSDVVVDWTDRVTRNLRVCGDTSSANFRYLNNKTIYKTILCEKLIGPAFGLDVSGGVSMVTLTYNGIPKRVMRFNPVTDQYAYIPLNFGEGELFDFDQEPISVYFTTNESDSKIFKASIITVNNFGEIQPTAISDVSLFSYLPPGSADMYVAEFYSGVNEDNYATILGSKDYTHYLKLYRTGSVSENIYVHHIKYGALISTAGDTYGGID